MNFSKLFQGYLPQKDEGLGEYQQKKPVEVENIDYKTMLIQKKLESAQYDVDSQNRTIEEAVVKRDLAMKEVRAYALWLDEVKVAKTA